MIFRLINEFPLLKEDRTLVHKQPFNENKCSTWYRRDVTTVCDPFLRFVSSQAKCCKPHCCRVLTGAWFNFLFIWLLDSSSLQVMHLLIWPLLNFYNKFSKWRVHRGDGNFKDSLKELEKGNWSGRLRVRLRLNIKYQSWNNGNILMVAIHQWTLHCKQFMSDGFL